MKRINNDKRWITLILQFFIIFYFITSSIYLGMKILTLESRVRFLEKKIIIFEEKSNFYEESLSSLMKRKQQRVTTNIVLTLKKEE